MAAGAASAPRGEAATPRGRSLGVAKRRWGEEVIKAILFLCALLSVVTTVGIVVSLGYETVKFFGDVGIDKFLFGTEWSPLIGNPREYGVIPLVTGTLLVTGIALIVAIPLGLGVAIYLAEYAKPRTRRIVKPAIELLAGIPTIVFGFFALTFVTPTILQALGIVDAGFNALSAGLVMGFMVLPTIASISEDSMSSVPASLREGSFGLGASKLQTTMRVVFPAALSGIVAAIVLGVSRAIGETMIVLVAAGQVPNLTADPRMSIETMTTFIAATAKGDAATGSIAYKTIFAVGTTLFVLTLMLNALSIRFVRKYRQVYE